MAFSGGQKVQIRAYLGYPQIWLQYSQRLEDAIRLTGADPDAEAYIVGLLDKITASQADWVSAQSAVAGVRTIDKDDVGFFNDKNQVLTGKAQVGRSLVTQLSAALGVPICTDIFSAAGYQSDAWMQRGVASFAGMC